MSAKETYPVDPLDCEALRLMLASVNNSQRAVDVHTARLQDAQAIYIQYFTRTATQSGKKDLSDLDQYMIDFQTNELKPVPAKPAEVPIIPTKAPDADEPPAPPRGQGQAAIPAPEVINAK